MGTFNNLKLKNIQSKKFGFGITTFLTVFVAILVMIIIIVEKGFQNSIFLILVILIVVSINLFKYYPYFKNKMELRDIDAKIYALSYSFLTYLNYKNKEETLQKLFSAHLDSEISNLYTKCSIDKPNYIKICKELSKYKIDVKYFALYTLFDIASEDNLYSLKEEEFIENARRFLKVHKLSFQSIKNSYLKKGLKEERKIIEEEARRKTAKEISKSFIPYKAYKILGVTPSVTKKQLKKVYRTLAKKYHPDKFYGKNNEIIEHMETKFQEITEAYEIIKRYKNYN